MSIRIMLLFLCGSREAILTIGHSRKTIWVAILLVLSAGLAREYDQEDLIANPIVLLAPLGASWLAASLLFVFALLSVLGEKESILKQYLSFLTLFWMTAPLAWLYAIPYEGFLSPIGATKANLITLGVVALWRVVLMIRVFYVFFGFPRGLAFFTVVLYSNVVALAGLTMLQFSLIGIMGGILSFDESEQLILSVTSVITGTSCYAIPCLGVALCISIGMREIRPPRPEETADKTRPVTIGPWVISVLALLIGMAALPFTQPKQQLSTKVKKLFYSKRAGEALDLMSSHSIDDFPNQWSPPPQRLYWDMTPYVKALEHLASHSLAPWVHEAYIQKGIRLVQSNYHSFRTEDIKELFSVLKQVRGGERVIQMALSSDSVAGERFQEVWELLHPPKPEP